MIGNTYTYHFDESVPAQELENTFNLAMLAIKSLHGYFVVRMSLDATLDKNRHICAINVHDKIGRDLALIFTSFVFNTESCGQNKVIIERTPIE